MLNMTRTNLSPKCSFLVPQTLDQVLEYLVDLPIIVMH
jgi:hypothetical protein